MRRGKNKIRLYHLTSPDDMESILRDGLKADDEGNIYLFTDMIVANEIAVNQVFLDRYAVVQIDARGVIGELLPDEVAEFTQGYHRIIRQDLVASEFVRHVGTFNAITDRATAWDYRKWKRLFGRGPEWVDKFFELWREASEGLRAITAKTGDPQHPKVQEHARIASERLNQHMASNGLPGRDRKPRRPR